MGLYSRARASHRRRTAHRAGIPRDAFIAVGLPERRAAISNTEIGPARPQQLEIRENQLNSIMVGMSLKTREMWHFSSCHHGG